MIKMASFRLFLAGCLSILFGASVVPAQAAEREVYRYSFHGQSIYADMYNYEDCIYTALNLGASTGRTKTDGRPIQASVLSGTIRQYNYCDDNYVYGYFSAELDDAALQIDRQLQTATLNTTVEVCDYWCSPLTLQLTWSGTGDTTREKANHQSQAENYKIIYRFDGETRQSIVSGSITTSLGTSNMGSSYAVIQNLKSGSTSIYKLS